MNLFKTEPATVISTVTAALSAVIGVAVAFGVDLSDTQRNAVLGAIAPLVTVIFLLGPIIRSQVTPSSKAEDLIERAYRMTPGNDRKPEL